MLVKSKEKVANELGVRSSFICENVEFIFTCEKEKVQNNDSG